MDQGRRRWGPAGRPSREPPSSWGKPGPSPVANAEPKDVANDRSGIHRFVTLGRPEGGVNDPAVSTRRAEPSSPTRGLRDACLASVTFGVEVVRRDLVEELPELLDLVLLLVGDRDARLLEDLLSTEDRRPGPKGERDGIRRTGADLHVAGEYQDGEVDAVLECGDPDLRELVADRLEQVAHQVVGQWPRWDQPVLRVGNRRGLTGTDPDRQIPVTLDLPQQHDRVVGGHFHADTNDVELLHDASLRPGGQPRLDECRMQPNRECGELTIHFLRPAGRVSSAGSAQRRDDLLDQADLPVSGRLDGSQ